jgi:uncharacterized Tic20 family protein
MAFGDAPPDLPPTEQPVEAPPQETALTAPTADERQWGMFAHLAALVGLLVGGLTFVGPLIVWLAKKDQSKFVDYHGKESLNFQLNILIYSLILVGISVASCGIALIGTGPLLGALYIYGIVMPIIAGLQANDGKLYEYPLTFRMIK